MPMLLENFMTSARLNSPYGWVSLIRFLPIDHSPFSQFTLSVGLITPASRADAKMMDLNVDPGSYASVMALFFQWSNEYSRKRFAGRT